MVTQQNTDRPVKETKKDDALFLVAASLRVVKAPSFLSLSLSVSRRDVVSSRLAVPACARLRDGTRLREAAQRIRAAEAHFKSSGRNAGRTTGEERISPLLSLFSL